jgi:[acyl-carrier-protein] S-malonyltransferase
MIRAFVFPGQGAQTIGMGRALAEAYPAAKAVFDEVDEALGEKLSALIWEGDQEELTLTRNAQPALMATSLAAMRALAAEGVTVEAAAFVAGHSLGEYSALAAAGAISVADTARLLRTRGQAMQDAVPVGHGAMAALLGLDFEAVHKIAKRAAHDTRKVCEAANDNDPAMAEALSHVAVEAPKVPVVANVLAHDVNDPETIRSLLVDQVTHSVRWRESVAWMVKQGVTEFWEIGAGKALSGMIRRIDRSAATRQVGTPDEVKAAVESLAE